MWIRRSLMAVCLWLAAVAPTVAQDEAAFTAELQEILDDFRIRYGFPGATAAIALPNRPIAIAATGLADIEEGRAMTPESAMLAASIGKTFVGAIVLALESNGRLSRTDLLAEHLGDRPWFDTLPNGGSITIGHLLRHRSGLPDHTHLPKFQAAFAAQVAAGEDSFTPEDLVSFVLAKAPLFPAGAGWAYSDTGYILLGLVIEKVTRRPYYEVLRDTLLDPLGMHATVPSNQPDIPDLAVGYTVPNNPFGLPERTADAAGWLVWDPAVEWTGGGLASTSGDLALWGRALFGGEALDVPYLERLLDGAPVAPDEPGILYGAGVAIYVETPRGPTYGHGGWIPAYVSSLRYYADVGASVAFQINSDVGIVDDTSDLVPALEAALADLALSAMR